MYKRRVKKNKRIMLILICLSFMGGVIFKAWASTEEKVNIKNEQIKMEEEKKKLEEEQRKIEDEKKKNVVGVKIESEGVSYDAKKVAEKLNKYDNSNDGKKIVFLTFDDGTSTTVTPEILNILKEENVKATFFLTGKNIDRGGENDLLKVMLMTTKQCQSMCWKKKKEWKKNHILCLA